MASPSTSAWLSSGSPAPSIDELSAVSCHALAEHGRAVARQPGQAGRASSHREQQRQRWPRHLRTGPVGPAGVCGGKPEATNSDAEPHCSGVRPSSVAASAFRSAWIIAQVFASSDISGLVSPQLSCHLKRRTAGPRIDTSSRAEGALGYGPASRARPGTSSVRVPPACHDLTVIAGSLRPALTRPGSGAGSRLVGDRFRRCDLRHILELRRRGTDRDSAVKVQIDSERCQGHGRCYDLAPDLFGDDDEGYGHGPAATASCRRARSARRASRLLTAPSARSRSSRRRDMAVDDRFTEDFRDATTSLSAPATRSSPARSPTGRPTSPTSSRSGPPTPTRSRTTCASAARSRTPTASAAGGCRRATRTCRRSPTTPSASPRGRSS